jgi:outer membrane protein assembly factor BamB
MTSRRALVLTVVAALAAGCAGRRHSNPAPAGGPSGSGGADSGLHTLGERGEKVLEDLPWHPAVLRANLAANGPVALTQIYVMAEDVLAVSTTGRLFCLSKRDLTPRWISTLRSPLAAPPAESALHYVFLEREPDGAAWLQWFSRRSGAEADRSPARLPYSPSSGVSATVGTAFIASLGSPNDNKTLETINLADGTPGWGYRSLGRVVATPTLDWSGESVLLLSEDRTVTSLPANQAGSAPAQINWQAETLAANTVAPAVAKDWAFTGSDDNFLRAWDSHSGEVKWMKGLDAPIRKSPWTLGRLVTKTVSTGGEGSTKARVEAFEGYVFARNSLGLFAFDATTGEDVFHDADADRPVVMVNDWVVTLDTAKQAQIRKGKGLPVVSTAAFGVFDFVPTNSRDGVVVAGLADGTILLAVPK